MRLLSNESFGDENYTEPVDPTAIFGPQRDPLYIVIPITIIYAIIFVTGLFGNIFTCIVIIRNKSMHTATNYYLFSLAISDLLLLVSGMPQEMYSIWSKWPYVFGHSFCLIRGLAAETSTNASVLTITLFTIERYLAICHPFVSHKMSKLSRAIKHVILLWVASFGLALPQALQFGIRNHRGVTMCLQTRVIIEHSFEISTFFFFFAPMILITVLYSLIGLRLKKTVMSKQNSEKDEFDRHVRYNPRIRRRNSQSTKRVVKMLVAVVVAFFVCWAPFHAQRLVAIYGTAENHLARSPILLFVYSILTYISGVFYYISTCVNPIFYHIMCHKFREAFKNTMVQWCCRGRREQRCARACQRCSYTAVGFQRHNGTLNSGSLRNDIIAMHTKSTNVDTKEQVINVNGQPLRVCEVCSKTMSPPKQLCRTHGCHRKSASIKRHKNSPASKKDRNESRNVDERTTTINEKPSLGNLCSPSCFSRQDESSKEMLTPKIVAADPSASVSASASSDDNRTEYYTMPSDKLTKQFKLRARQKDMYCL